MLLTTKEIFKQAQNNNYAAGAFNVFNLESVQAVFRAARNKRSPIVVNVSEKALRYAGIKNIVAIVKAMAQEYKEIPCALQLDHGKGFESVRDVILAGFSSVMIDGSRLSFRDNIALTKKVVSFAKKHKAAVQAELGIVPYLGEKIDEAEIKTDPDEAEIFIKETKIDSLAVAIGNAHGFVEEKSLDVTVLEKISKKINIPFVLHGASDFPPALVSKVAQRGVACFHIDTVIRVAFTDSLRKKVCVLPLNDFDPRSILANTTLAMQDVIEKKMEIFGSAGKI